jgi:hypothetical protein
VDVDADPEIRRHTGGGFERIVAAGERGMDADQAAASRGQKPAILLEPPPRPVFTVAIGDAVGAHNPDSDLCAGIGDRLSPSCPAPALRALPTSPTT